jgi:simple sugar transport system permease protein
VVPTTGLRRALAGWRIERKPDPRRMGLYRVVAVCIGIAVALLVAPLLSTTSASTFYNTAWTGTLGSPLGLSNLLAVAAPLIIAGLAASIPLRLGLWNIGIDGQILIGAWCATGLSYLLPHLSGAALIPLMMIAGLFGGALWIVLPALARVMLGVNEIVTTFLLNFVATAWMTYWITGPWLDPNSGGGGIRARPIPQQSELSLINVNGTLVHWGVAFAVALPLLVAGVIRYSRMGYELTITGGSERASRYAGVNVRRRQIGVMLVGGALAGLAGTIDMMGTIHQYSDGLTNNRGFDAVVVAVLAGGSAIGVFVMGLLYALLLAGSDAVSVVGVSNELVYGLIGITLMLGALGEAAARLKLVHTRQAEPAAEIDALETAAA